MQNTSPSQPSSDAALENLLGRQLAPLAENRIQGKIQGRVVLVTGAAGSIGSELCRHIAAFQPLALIGFDQAETPLLELEAELKGKFPGVDFHSEIGNITRPDDVDQTMGQFRPSIVYHAAAYKHVSMLEKHPLAAVYNNIFGTWNVAQSAAGHLVECFVLISTDKAVRPASMLGVTKRVAELLVKYLHGDGPTRFISVRFGNVWASSGSVVPIFRQQIAAGGPVTVSHPEMQRYFLTAAEACQLILQASVLGQGGDTFVLDMGEPLKILDLARSLILQAGLEPEKDIQIRLTGARPGEKLIEDLKLPGEVFRPTPQPRILRVAPCENADQSPDLDRLRQHWLQLRLAAASGDRLQTILLLQKLVPDYTPSAQLLNDAGASPLMGLENSTTPAPAIEVHDQEPSPAAMNH